jgi:hypothetical protein
MAADLAGLKKLLERAAPYEKHRDHVTRDGSDELTARDIADGYRQGYQELHRLTCQVARLLPAAIEEIETVRRARR